MKIEELRVGNYVRVKYYAYDEVDTYNKITGITEEHPFVNTIVFDYLEYDEIEVIPLTEEWLLKFGFVKDNNGNYWIDLQTHYLELIPSNSYWYPVYAQVPEMSSEEEQSVSLNRIKNVHQLQNLYFTLTGQEL